MPSCADIGCVNRSGKNPSLSLHQIPSNKQKEIRQEWLHHIKRGENEKYLPKDLTYICLKYFQNDCFKRDLQVSFINFLNVSVKNIH